MEVLRVFEGVQVVEHRLLEQNDSRTLRTLGLDLQVRCDSSVARVGWAKVRTEASDNGHWLAVIKDGSLACSYQG